MADKAIPPSMPGPYPGVERLAQVHLNELMAFHRQTKEHFDDAMRAWHAETEGLTEEQESMDADYLIDRRDSIESLMDSSIEGRKKSSQNALRHGVTAQTTVMNEVDRNFHDVFCADIVAEFNPVGAMETFLASSIAEEAWRLNHSRAQCDNIIAIGQFDGTGDRFDTEHPEIHTAITAAGTTRDNAITLELLSLYRQRIHRAFEKYSAQLKTLQAERRQKQQEDLEMARKLCQMTEPQNLPYSRRYHREEAARQADSIRREDSQPTGTAKRSCKWPPETANFMSKPNPWPTRTPYLRAAGNN